MLAMKVDKEKLRERVIEALTVELTTMSKAAADAREAATHEESKPENDKDTRGLEASYLAGAQAARAEELKRNIAFMKALTLERFGDAASAKATALLELDDGDQARLYFLLPSGGGVKVPSAEGEITVLTPESPLGRAVLGKQVGDTIEVVTRAGAREYEILRMS